MTAIPKFGFLYFPGGKPIESGYIAIAGEKATPHKLASSWPSALRGGRHILWSNMSRDILLAAGVPLLPGKHMPIIKHAFFLTLPPEDIVAEFGIDLCNTEGRLLCEKLAVIFSRLMTQAWHLLADAMANAALNDAASDDPTPAIIGADTLSDAIQKAIPGLTYPEGDLAARIVGNRRSQSFTRTKFTPRRDSVCLVLRRPRVTHGRALLATRVPAPSSLDKIDIKETARLQEIMTADTPTMGHVIIRNIAKNVAPVYGYGKFSYARQETRSHWLCQDEIAVLSDFVDMEAIEKLSFGRYAAAGSILSAPLASFVSSILPETSISAGILLESLWRAFLLPAPKSRKAFSYRTQPLESWQGIWLAARDRILSLSYARAMVERGHHVISHGNGWLHISVSPNVIRETILDGLSLGLLPSFLETQKISWPAERDYEWGGDKKLKAISHFLLTNNKDILWALDDIPYEKEKRADFLASVMATYG